LSTSPAISSAYLRDLAKWREMEKAAIDEERQNQWLRIENSRLEKELRDASCANRGSTVELDNDESSRKRSRSQI